MLINTNCTPSFVVPASYCEWPPPAPPIGPAQLPLLSVLEKTAIAPSVTLTLKLVFSIHCTLNLYDLTFIFSMDTIT